MVLDIELSVSAWYRKTRRVLLRARRLLLLLLAAASGGVRQKFKITYNRVKQNNDCGPVRTPEKKRFFGPYYCEIPPHPKHTRLKIHFFSSGNSFCTSKAAASPKGKTSDMPSVQPTEQPRTSPPGSWGSEHMPLYPPCVRLPECSVSRVMATGSGKK